MNLNSIAVTGKKKEALGVDILKAAFPNGLEMSDTLYAALSELAGDKKVTVYPTESEVNSVRQLSILMGDPAKAGEIFVNDLELALLAKEVATPAA